MSHRAEGDNDEFMQALSIFRPQGINEERRGSDYSEFRSQSEPLTRHRLLDEIGCSELPGAQ